MADESFMLLSLKEGQSKKLAQVISNDTSRQILDYLANKDFATETQISKDTKIALSTVHYNVKALKESGLIVDDEYHYSEKGKEVPHYKLAKKFIIIAPKDEKGVMDKIKRFFPVTAIAAVAAGAIHLMQKTFGFFSNQSASVMTLSADAASDISPKAAPILSEAEIAVDQVTQKIAEESSQEIMRTTAGASNTLFDSAMQNLSNVSQNISQNLSSISHNTSFPYGNDVVITHIPIYQQPIALWFLGGALFVLLSLALWELVKAKK